ncbi:PEP-CTERM sorting domain-containing protein [Rugamonas sp. CCM 8940]|uniref:PEP-CTERM sorting domain-containing protein n=1 Tax=Rugamonas sp. CCM 8940 TaxID=2765359 RepID=UPI001F1E7631|nr:PEP-CTERM sorting domain-containing protein [Rugamonas sp. CCM 8940]
MKFLRSTRLLLSLLGAFAAASGAHAANMVEVGGLHAKYFYDSDYWGAGALTVVDNSLTFALSNAFSLSTTMRQADGHSQKNLNTYSQIWAIADDGYVLGSATTSTVTGQVKVSSKGSYASLQLLSTVSSASWDGSRISTLDNIEWVYNFPNKSGSDGAYDGKLVGVETSKNDRREYSALLIGLSNGLIVDQEGVGQSSATVNTIRYDFTVMRPVPEPETYAMLLAGLGLVGFMARRRQRGA